MTNKFLLLNSDKTEILLIGPKNISQNLLDYSLHLDGCTVTSSTQGSKLTFLLGSTGAPNFKRLGAPTKI